MKSRHNITIDDEVWYKLENLSKRNRRSISSIIEWAVNQQCKSSVELIEGEMRSLQEKLMMLNKKKEELIEDRERKIRNTAPDM